MRRRHFLTTLAGAGLAAAADIPDSIRSLKPMTAGVKPITDDERRARMEKARRLMRDNKIDAIFLEPGSSLVYYTGIQWGRSERMFGMLLPQRGEPAYIVPGFEEMRAREQIRFGNDIRVWQEDESPAQKVAQASKDRGISSGRIGIEETVRFFLANGIRQAAPALEYVDATPVSAGCRMIKSTAEIALLQHANDVTLTAIKATAGTLQAGMTQHDIGANLSAAYRALGFQGGGLVNLGESSAFPHGSVQPRKLREGDIVLIDTGTQADGYESDITRTWVFGKPSARQRQVWEVERKAQDAAFNAAQPGATCESVDAAARKVITDAGFGPDYKVPGLPHRTGHGIGLDGHEWTNFVRGNKTKIAPGMCFSDEPMIAIYGEFGIRLEDCLYITDSGPRFFTPQSASIDKPFA